MPEVKAIIPGLGEAPQAKPEGTANQEPKLESQGIEVDSSMEQSAVPEKFVGKSAHEIIKSYQEAEKHMSKVSSESAQAKKEAEEAKSRASLAEKELQELRHRLNQQPQSRPQPQPEVDPLQEFDKRFEQDPREAVRYMGRQALESARRAEVLAEQRVQAQLAQNHYESLKKDNPDFAELEPEMNAIAQRYAGYLRPEVANRPEVVELMYKLAKGTKVDMYVQRAIEKAKQSGELVRDEKRQAFAESSNSQGEVSKRPEDMTFEELEALLKKA